MRSPTLHRRQLLAASAAMGLARPALGQGTSGTPRVLKFVPQSDLAVLDPIVTTANVARYHGYAVFDTLYGFNQDYAAEPQMAEGHEVAQDGRRITIRLREGLKFHDGTPVRGADCVASIRRWAARDPLGQVLLTRIEELSAPDDRSILLRLSRPFPQLFAALAKPSAPVCFIMPERLAATDPARPVAEIIGSGPFRFVERIPGTRVVYDRFADYVPRAEGIPTWTAGPKRVNFDRVEWHIKPDAAAAAAALQAGEVDWWENPLGEMQATLRRNRGIVLEVPDPIGFIGMARFNALHPPFDKPAIRRILLGAIDQDAFMAAVVGADRSLWRDDIGIFPPGTPLANDEGLGVLTSARDPERVKRELSEAGYAGEKVVLLAANDFPTLSAIATVGAETLKRVGMDVEVVSGAWSDLIQRRARREPPERGGWSMFFTFWTGLDMMNPGVNQALRGTGDRAWFGWPTMPRMEELRAQWIDAPNLEAEQRLAREIQGEALREAPYLPLGQYFQATAYRRGLSGMLKGLPVFWNITRG